MPQNQHSVSTFSKGKPPSHRSVRSSKSKEKSNPENVGPTPNPDHQMNHTESLKNGASQHEELVKYMSKVPGFLQREERVEDNVLNFGVLDWGRLEKWTQRQNNDSLSKRSFKPSNGCSTSLKPTKNSLQIDLSRKFDCSPVIEPLGDRIGSSLEGTKIQTKDKPRPNDGPELRSTKGKEKEKHLDNDITRVSKHFHRFSDTARGKIVSRDKPEKSVVLISPKDFYTPGSSEVRSRVPLDGKVTDFNWGSFSDIFSVDEIQSYESPSEVGHSCPLSHETETELDSKLDELIKSQGVELQIDPSLGPNEKSTRVETSRSARFRSSMDFDQRTPSFSAEMTRDSSGSHRFSFSLSRMSKSLSFREGSSRFQLGSIYGPSKSGPAEPTKHTRTSPLKKLLNPLLKNRSGNQVKIEPPIAVPIHESEQRGVSRIQALLHLTAKGELPLFKFVVEARNEILASTVKSLSMFGKNDSKWLYTFYSVQQLTKKSGVWKHHKAKPCGFSYNVIGQMKVSDPHVPSWCEKIEERYLVKESVLCSVDLNSANSEFISSRELGAVVVMMPSTIGKRDHSFFEGVMKDEGFDLDDGMLGNTVVILPGGMHSLPNGGEPSPLIKRWRSGGLCDCGGWDVGCKLRILTNKGEDDETVLNSRRSLTQVRCHLFEQGEAKQSGPVFSLIPFRDGLFSVEYDADISSLQAFSICVTLINSHSSPYTTNEAELIQDMNRSKMSMTRPSEGREKNTPLPPLSPVGRV